MAQSRMSFEWSDSHDLLQWLPAIGQLCALVATHNDATIAVQLQFS